MVPMHRGFSYRLQPTPAQAEKFDQYAGVCRLIWNLALEQRRNHWRAMKRVTGHGPTFYSQLRELTDLRASFDFIAAVGREAEEMALRALDTAYDNFYKGTGGYPAFKKKGNRDAFTLRRGFRVRRLNRRWGAVTVPTIGEIRFRMHRPTAGKIVAGTLSRSPLGWQISLTCEIDATLPDNGLTVGIDRGVTLPVVLSDGTSYTAPAGLAASEQAARKAQRAASRKKRGSNRHKAALRRTARLKARSARIRNHWQHTVNARIAKAYGGAAIEHLKTRSMTATAKGTLDQPGTNVRAKSGLNRAILNIGWHGIATKLAYKLPRIIMVDPAYTSQTCAACDHVDSRNRESQASFVCTSCGHIDNADHNAAVVILNRGIAASAEPTVRKAMKRKPARRPKPDGQALNSTATASPKSRAASNA